MASLSHDDEEGISLFPMFNILACTLGVMVFVLATVASVSLGADKAVEYSGPEFEDEMQGRVPTWMEWDGRSLTVHPDGTQVTFERDLRDILTFDATYTYLFDQIVGTPMGAEVAAISGDPDRYLMLLVRPSGFRTMPELQGYMELLGIDVVPEPIPQDLRRIQVQ